MQRAKIMQREQCPFAKSLVEKDKTKKDLGEIQEKLENEFAAML